MEGVGGQGLGAGESALREHRGARIADGYCSVGRQLNWTIALGHEVFEVLFWASAIGGW